MRSSSSVCGLILNDDGSGPSPCVWLSHTPWVDVTPPTTTASPSHRSPMRPSASPLLGRVRWFPGSGLDYRHGGGLASEHVRSDGALEGWVRSVDKRSNLPILSFGFLGKFCLPSYSPPGLLDRVGQPRLGHVSPSPITG